LNYEKDNIYGRHCAGYFLQQVGGYPEATGTRHGQDGEVFYSSNAVVVTKVITVKIGANDYGQLHYSAAQPGCAEPGFGSIKLAPGSYVADYIDQTNPNATKQVSFTVPSSATTCVFFNLK
jgi:hypothetical protein